MNSVKIPSFESLTSAAHTNGGSGIFLLISLVIHSKTFYSIILSNLIHSSMGANNDYHGQITAGKLKFDNVLSRFDSSSSGVVVVAGFDYVLQVAGLYGNR